MAEERRKSRRLELVSQAGLVWAKASPEQLRAFVETGSFEATAESDVLPYDPALREAIVKEFERAL